LGLRVSCVSYIGGAFFWRVLSENGCACVRDSVVCSGFGLSQQSFELGEDLLDRIEVGRVFGQEHDARADGSDGLSHRLSLVGAEIVEDDDVARLEGNPEHHEYELYLALEDIDHSRTKTKSPQTNGIFERFHKTVLDEFYRVVFRKKIYRSIAELQADLDAWVQSYNEDRAHQGRWCFANTPMQTFLDATPLAKEKMIAA
jgi:Integrase core domain